MFKNSIVAMVFGGLLVPSGLCAMDGREQPVEEETKEAAAAQELTPAERRALLTLDQKKALDEHLLTILTSSDEMVDFKVSILLEQGADVNVQNEQGKSALKVAIERHNSGVVRVLEKFGAHVDEIDQMFIQQMWKNEKLIRAVKGADAQGIIDAFEKGADGEAKGMYGRTPLLAAMADDYPDYDIIALLLDYDVLVYRPNWTFLDQPLVKAITLYDMDIIRQLIVAGAQVNQDTMSDSDKAFHLQMFQEDFRIARAIRESLDVKKMLDAHDWSENEVPESFKELTKGKIYFNEVVKREIKRRHRQGKVKELVLFYVPVKELSKLVGDYIGFYNRPVVRSVPALVEPMVVAEEEIKEETEDGVVAERIAASAAPYQSTVVEAEDEVACFNCTALNNTRDRYCTVCRAALPDSNGFFDQQ